MAHDKRAYPLAPPELETKLIAMAQSAARFGLVKKGANEATKALNKAKAELILIAADTDPLEIVLHLPLVCEDKNVPYVFVSGKQALGRACGVVRPVIAAAVLATDNQAMDTEIQQLKIAVEQLPI